MAMRLLFRWAKVRTIQEEIKVLCHFYQLLHQNDPQLRVTAIGCKMKQHRIWGHPCNCWATTHHPKRADTPVWKRKKEEKWTGRENRAHWPSRRISHSSDSVCCAVDLSTRISSAEWTTLLYQTETSAVETLPWATVEGRLLEPGLLVLKLQVATWGK